MYFARFILGSCLAIAVVFWITISIAATALAWYTGDILTHYRFSDPVAFWAIRGTTWILAIGLIYHAVIEIFWNEFIGFLTRDPLRGWLPRQEVGQ